MQVLFKFGQNGPLYSALHRFTRRILHKDDDQFSQLLCVCTAIAAKKVNKLAGAELNSPGRRRACLTRLAFGKRDDLIDRLMCVEQTLLNLPLEGGQRRTFAWNEDDAVSR